MKFNVRNLLIGLVIVAVLVALAGRAFCAWGCPVPLLRRVFGIKERKADKPTPAERDGANDSRNWVLGATVLTTAAFGFPVFCLICPVGLSVATFIALWRLLQFSEATLSLVVFPVILVAEIVLLRKWCHRFCPPGRPAGPHGAVEPHVPSDGGRRVLPALLGRQLLAVRRRVPRGD